MGVRDPISSCLLFHFSQLLLFIISFITTLFRLLWPRIFWLMRYLFWLYIRPASTILYIKEIGAINNSKPYKKKYLNQKLRVLYNLNNSFVLVVVIVLSLREKHTELGLLLLWEGKELALHISDGSLVLYVSCAASWTRGCRLLNWTRVLWSTPLSLYHPLYIYISMAPQTKKTDLHY